MKLTFLIALIIIRLSLSAQYAPQANTEGTTAIHMDSSIIVSWATGYKNYIAGPEVDEIWQTPEKALGQAVGASVDIVCLGRGGQITFIFDTLIVNKEGADFVTFENALNHTFLELAWVEVSMDGIYFERFPNRSLTMNSVGTFGDINPTKINGYCSKYRQAYGTPFNLDSVNLDTIQYIRFVDIVGDGNALDTDGNIIYDPYPTTESAGEDIEAIGVINAGKIQEGIEEISNSGFNIFPNPASENFQLIVSNFELGTKFVEIQIFDLTGNIVINYPLKKKINNQQIDVSSLKNGLYIVKLGQITEKLIIRKN